QRGGGGGRQADGGDWRVLLDQGDGGRPGKVLFRRLPLPLGREVAGPRVVHGEQAAPIDRQAEQAAGLGGGAAVLGMVEDGDGDAGQRRAVGGLDLAAQHGGPQRVDGAGGHARLEGVTAGVKELRRLAYGSGDR